MVYVLNIDGQPLMPTSRYGKIRKLLKENKAKVIRKTLLTERKRVLIPIVEARGFRT